MPRAPPSRRQRIRDIQRRGRVRQRDLTRTLYTAEFFVGAKDGTLLHHGYYWVKVHSMGAMVPSEAWDRSAIQPGELYFYAFDPVLDEDDPLVVEAPDVLEYWHRMCESNKYVAVRFVDVYDAVFSDNDAVDAMYWMGDVAKRFVESKYSALKRSELFDTKAVSVRCCVPLYIIQMWGDALKKIMGEKKRRFVDRLAEAELRTELESSRDVSRISELSERLEVGVPIVSMTMTGLHQYWRNSPYVGGDFVVTLQELIDLAKTMHTKLVVLDAVGRTIGGHVPEDGRSRLPALAVLVKDHHLYALTHNLASLFRSAGDHDTVRAFLDSVKPMDPPKLRDPSPNFQLREYIAPTFFDSELEAIASTNVKITARHGGRAATISTTGNFDLRKLYYKFRELGLDPRVSTSNYEITSISFCVVITEEDTVEEVEGEDEDTEYETGKPKTAMWKVSRPPVSTMEIMPTFDRTSYDLYIRAKTILLHTLKPDMISHYSEQLLNALTTGNFVGPIYGRGETPVTQHDMCRAYTWALRRVCAEGFMRFNTFDAFRPFECIEPHSLYAIEGDAAPDLYSNLSILIHTSKAIVTGAVLALAVTDPEYARLGFHVVSQCRASSILSGEAVASALDVLYSESNQFSKFAVNEFIGQLGKIYSKSESTFAFGSEEEALHYASGAYPYCKDPGIIADDTAYFVTQKASVTLVSGMRPLWVSVVSFCRMRLYRKAKTLSSWVGVHTDAIFTTNDAPLAPKCSTAEVMSELGVWSVQKETPPPAPRPRDESFLESVWTMLQPLPEPEVETIELEDEFNPPSDLLHISTNIQADGPGCGKTFLYKKLHPDALIVTPFNSLRHELSQTHSCVVTAHTLLGLLADGSRKEAYDLSNVSHVLLDEFAMHPVDMQQKLFDHFPPEITVCYTTDFHQLPPISNLRWTDDYDSIRYYERILNTRCPRRLLLHTIKRVSTAEDRLFMRTMLDRLWGTLEEQALGIRKSWTLKERDELVALIPRSDSLDPVFATYYNASASAISKRKHERKATLETGFHLSPGAPYVTNQRLICRKHFVSNGHTFQVNVPYILRRVDPPVLSLPDSDQHFDVSKTRLTACFRYFGTDTAHALQGRTVQGPLSVADWNAPLDRATRMWWTVVLTRSTVPSQLRLYSGAPVRRPAREESPWREEPELVPGE